MLRVFRVEVWDGKYLERTAVNMSLALAAMRAERAFSLKRLNESVHAWSVQNSAEVVSFILAFSLQPVSRGVSNKALTGKL